MSDDNHPTSTKQHPAGSLLDELGSIRELLDDELDRVVPYTSVDEITSVEDYLRLKQQAAAAGLSIDDYLGRQVTAQPVSEEPEAIEEEETQLVDELYPVEEELFVSDSPLQDLADEEDEGNDDALDELYATEESELLELAEEMEEADRPDAGSLSVEAYFAAVAAAKRPQQERTATTTEVDEEVGMDETIPLLDEMVEMDEAIPLLDEVVELDEEVPLLDEVVELDEAIPLLDEVVELDEAIPLLDEAVELDEAIPLLDEVVALDEAVPLLDEVATAAPAGAQEPFSREDLQGLVDLIVNRKLERLKPELEREVLDELRKLLSLP
jgi:hypothetical protein